jgi:hypothetical protein
VRRCKSEIRHTGIKKRGAPPLTRQSYSEVILQLCRASRMSGLRLCRV